MANKRARYLRGHMTPQEVKLWVHLRAWRANGFHFRRQAPVLGFIVDFVCLKHRLIVEADGSGHARHYGALADQERDRTLAAAGYRILRFWNNDIDDNLSGVLDAVYAALDTDPDPTPGLRPDPPRSGEG